MKTRIENLFLLPALIAGLSLILAGRVSAQTYTNFDGVNPNAGLVVSATNLYGTTAAGGGSGKGTVFALETDGSGFRLLHDFSGGSDGASPWDGLLLWGNTLYGTAYSGGSSGKGTVFALNTDGTGFTTLHTFTGGSGGAYPIGGLILTNNTLYGTARFGGSSGKGTVFSISFAPQLTITPSGIPPSGIILSWPTNFAGFDYTGYTLQCATNLASPLVWNTNSPTPVLMGELNTIINPIIGPQQFYRLTK